MSEPPRDPPADPRVEPAPPPRRPKVWPVFVSLVIALIGGLALTAVVLAIVIVPRAVAGEDVQAITDGIASDPLFFMLSSAPMQAAFLATALVHARLTKRGVRGELRLRRSRVRPATGYLLVAGTVIPLAVSVLAAAALAPLSFSDPEDLASIWGDMPLAVFPLWIAFISLAPGVCEETLFRGLIQTRLERRWGATPAILVTSLLFGLVHVDPPAIALAFVLGLWFGFIARATGSIWPAIAMHAFVNGFWNILQVVGAKLEPAENAATITVLAMLVLSAVCLGVGMLRLRRDLRVARSPGDSRSSHPP